MTEESKVSAEAPQETGLILPNKPQDKHNLLIFTGQEGKTYQNWQRAVDAVTPKKSQTNEEKLAEYMRTRKPTKVEREFAHIKSLPENFCVFCGNTQVAKEDQVPRGISWMFNEEIVAVGIRAGEFVNAGACKKCVDNIEHERDFQPLELSEFYWEDRTKKRKETVDKRIIDYIYSQRLAGVTGDIFGDESRRERFRDYDTESY